MENISNIPVEKVTDDIMIAGSDICEIKCEPCTDDGKYLTADGFCQDCEEFLCSSCFTIHTKVRAYRDHVLLDKSQMPTTKPNKKLNSGDEDNCLQHIGELIQFYCKQHFQVGCHICLTIHHQNCQTVEISDLAKGLSDTDEFKDVFKSLTELNIKHKEHLHRSKQNVKEAENYHKDVLVEIEKLHDMLNKSRKLTEDKAMQKKETDIKKLKTVSRRCDTVMSEIGKLTVELESKHGASLFISMINAKNHAKPFEESLRTLDQDNKIERYVFKPTDQIRTTFNSVLGHFSNLPCKVSTISQETFGNEYMYGNITCLTVINYNMMIVGANVYNGQNTVGRMAIIDEKYTLQVKSEIKFPTTPFALTETENDQIAATFPGENTIRLIGYTPGQLSEDRTIQASGSCNGIAFSKGTLVVSFLQPAKIEIMDLKKAVVLKRYALSNAAGQPQQYVALPPGNAFESLQYPNYVSVSPDGTTLYVSEKTSVSSITLQGEIKETFKSGNEPTGVVFDDEGTPTVAGWHSYPNDQSQRYDGYGCNSYRQMLSVYRLCDKNISIKVFQESEDKIQYQEPSNNIAKAMAFNKNNNSLFVVTENEIKVIRFK